MRPLVLIGLVCLALVLVPAVQAGTADVAVTATAVDPAVLMRGDTGTLSVTVTNTGTGPVEISRARLSVRDLQVLKNPYPSVGDLGPGNSRTFTFTIRADAQDGYYYPKFELQFATGNSLRVPVLVRVDDTDLLLSVTEQPESFYAGKREAVAVTVGNPRSSPVTGVSVSLRGEGVEVTPTSRFIGTLAADARSTVIFNITPSQAATLDIRAIYYNGPTLHQAENTLPITFQTPKKAAAPLLSNIEVEKTGGAYQVTGDVINAGLKTAHSVVITADTPGKPVDPFRLYVVGALEPDDFSSFEVTFEAEAGDRVPLLVTYTDADGNAFERRVPVEISGTGGAATEGESGSVLPVAAVIVLCAVAVAGAIAWSWKKR
ncbi:MAG: COG1361 S-layer family protein [Methanomicrobiales archaeon]